MVFLTIIVLILALNSIAFADNIISVTMNGSNVAVKEVPLLVDGQAIKSEVPTFIHIDRTMVPIRFVAESFGADVTWDQNTKTASVAHGNNTVKLTIDSDKVYFNGQTLTMDKNSIPKLVTFANEDSRTMVPVRFVSEILGYEVGWDEVNRIPYINSKDDGDSGEEVVDLNPEANVPEVSLTNINNIQVVKGSTDSGKIAISIDSKVNLLDTYSSRDRQLTINIPNSRLNISGKTINVNDKNISSIVYETSPEDRYSTRVTVSLKGSKEYSIYESSDGKTQYISFEDHQVDNIKKENIDGNDAIVIKDLGNVKYNIMKLSNPERVVVDLMDSTLANKIYSYDYKAEFIDGVRVSQFSGDKNYSKHDRIVRLVLDVKAGVRNPEIKVDDKNGDLIITPIVEKTQLSWDHIKYEGSSNEKNIVIENSKRTTYDVMYLPAHKRLDIEIPMSATDLEAGIINVHDGFISIIEVSEVKQDDNVRVSIYFNREVEHEVLSKNRADEIEIQLIGGSIPDRAPGEELVVLDPGHGGSDPGAMYGGINEKDINLSVALKTKSKLEAMGYKVLMTRYDDSTVDIYERPKIANNAKADIFVSIHYNAFSNQSVAGLETYYCPRDRGDGKTKEQFPLASEVHNSILASTGANNRNVRQQAGFVVIRQTNMPAILIEGGYMSNPDELKLISSDSYQDLIAEGLSKGIKNYFEKY